jgi:predicted metal-dependent RNase
VIRHEPTIPTITGWHPKVQRRNEMSSTTVDSATEIRPFHVEVREEELADLRRRIAATRWPEKETVTDQSQGVQLTTMQELIRYWGPTTTSGGSSAAFRSLR